MNSVKDIDWEDMTCLYQKADPMGRGYMSARLSELEGSTIPSESPYELGSREYEDWLLGRNAARADEASGDAL